MDIAEQPQLQSSPLLPNIHTYPLCYVTISEKPVPNKMHTCPLKEVPPKLHPIMYPVANPGSLGGVQSIKSITCTWIEKKSGRK